MPQGNLDLFEGVVAGVGNLGKGPPPEAVGDRDAQVPAVAAYAIRGLRGRPEDWEGLRAGMTARCSAPSVRIEPQGEGERHEGKATLVLKCFFLAMSIGLIASTLLGIYMAFKFNRSRSLIWGLLIAGAGIPTALIATLK